MYVKMQARVSDGEARIQVSGGELNRPYGAVFTTSNEEVVSWLSANQSTTNVSTNWDEEYLEEEADVVLS